MRPLHAFLEEMKAAPKAREAIRDGKLLNGKPVSELVEWWEQLFNRLEGSDQPFAVKLHDEAVQIVSRKSEPLKKRFLALVELLEPYDPDRRKQ